MKLVIAILFAGCLMAQPHPSEPCKPGDATGDTQGHAWFCVGGKWTDTWADIDAIVPLELPDNKIPPRGTYFMVFGDPLEAIERKIKALIELIAAQDAELRIYRSGNADLWRRVAKLELMLSPRDGPPAPPAVNVTPAKKDEKR